MAADDVARDAPDAPDTTPVKAGKGGAPGASVARGASLLALGNVASRGLGLLREMMIAALFGASGQVSAFRVAAQVPTLVYDFLIGGMLSAALVPVLSQTLRLRPRAEFTQLVGVLVGVFGAVLAGLVVVLEFGAPLLTQLLAGGFAQSDPALLGLTTQLIRLMAPAVWLFSMAGLLMAVLYAQQRFSMPALATAIYNLGILLAAPLLARRLGIASLALGVLLGAGAQLAVMGWDVRRSRVSLRPSLNWRHPALGKILRLYAPIALGLLVMLFQVGLDRRLASGTGAQSIAWMATATTLQQMPLGLISVAIALASLPSLSQYFAVQDETAFRRTLGRGLRMVLCFLAPAAVALWLLGTPVTRLLFERGAFTAADTEQVVRALRIYLIGMVFAAVDFPLNFAFYARNNTLLPALVGVASVGVYVAVALALVGPLGFTGLVWADTAKQAAHALVMAALLAWTVGALGAGVRRGMAQIGLAAAAMAAVTAVLSWTLRALTVNLGGGDVDHWSNDALQVLIAGGGGLLVYVAVLWRLRFDEVLLVWRRVKRGV